MRHPLAPLRASNALACLLSATLACLAGAGSPRAQPAYDGPTLVHPQASPSTELIDLDGNVLQAWAGRSSSLSAYLLDDGSILRPCTDPNGLFQFGGAGGCIQRIGADGTILWDWFYSTPQYQQHHDIEPLPGGNLLLIAWERKSAQEALDLGRTQVDGFELWPTVIVEVEPVGATGGNIVWEWYLWDHLVQEVDPAKPNYGLVADHPERLDINVNSRADSWIHANYIDYDPVRDHIIFSSRNLDEIFVIDHSTTTAEAAGSSGGNSGKGGDFLYRWGNPQNYGRGTEADRRSHGLHGGSWIDAGRPGHGNVLLFDNGDRAGLDDDSSRVLEFVPPVDSNGRYPLLAPGEAWGPDSLVWEYSDPGNFFSPFLSNAERLPNGNTLVCEGDDGRLFEVAPSGSVVWEYFASAPVFAARRYFGSATSAPPAPRWLTAGPAWPNPANPMATVPWALSRDSHVRATVHDVAGREVAVLLDGSWPAGEHELHWAGRDAGGAPVASGIYRVVFEADGQHAVARVVLAR